ncbi:MAG: hypothetical protein KatS3mg034_0285 [Vicingaceae bacterium]|nr:MAG: hypothetical protein KatS3mg034_0285 [Vicingaceae bacterium]
MSGPAEGGPYFHTAFLLNKLLFAMAAGLSVYPAATKPGRQAARQPTAEGSPGDHAGRLAEGRGIAAKAVHAPDTINSEYDE